MISRRFFSGRYRLQALVNDHLCRLSTSATMLTLDDLNPAVHKVQYAVRGELAIKAEEFREALKDPNASSSLPFSKVVSSNIGNPQQKGLDQPPITFGRQVCLFSSSFSIHRDLLQFDVVDRSIDRIP
jgi:hypothetical protein